MRSLSLLVILGVSVPAWATGERVLMAKDNPLRATLCTSMECVHGGARDAVVSVRAAAKGSVEFVVTDASGQVVRLVHKAPLNSAGQVGSTDLACASAAVISAIENPKAAAPAPKAATARGSLKKLPRGKLVARR